MAAHIEHSQGYLINTRYLQRGLQWARFILALSVICISPSVQASVLYTYDSTGRIAAALYDNNVCLVYTYDANGNQTSRIVNAAGSPNTALWGTGVFGCFRWSS